MDGKTFIFSQQKEESFQNYLGSIKGALKNTTDRLLGLYSLKLAFPLVYSRFANSRFGTRILAKIKPKMNRFHPLWWPQLSHTPYTILHHTRFVCFFFFFYHTPSDEQLYLRHQWTLIMKPNCSPCILEIKTSRFWRILTGLPFCWLNISACII